MHELSITQRIAKVAIKHAEQNQAQKIVALHLVIGQLSSVVDDSVRFYWDIVTEGTLCEGASLHFERIPAKLRCKQCGHEYNLQNGELRVCPSCESPQVDVVQGREFRLESIDIE
jgi:hydrogenase nickel incorporation protein HypA/HybF